MFILGPSPRAEPHMGSTALGWTPENPTCRGHVPGNTFELGPSPRAEPYMGSTAKAGPRNTPLAGATLEENGTSVAVRTAPKPDPGRAILEALARTAQQQGSGETSL